MQVQNGTISFNRHRNDGPRSLKGEVIFPAPVTQAAAVLRGFDVGFSPRDDHHLGNLEVRLDAAIDPLAPQRVNVEAIFGLRDWSGSWDDNYEGEIHFTVLAE
ncbi:MAG: hypothetical protein ROZ64_09180 [Burkholderiaceae bacterium]|jgi:hypothetical protein|nr:hypothetical protein [Burkholderiaceae bacterium]